MFPCGKCGRTFNENALARHGKICQGKAGAAPKRPVYDSKAKMLEGIEGLQDVRGGGGGMGGRMGMGRMGMGRRAGTGRTGRTGLTGRGRGGGGGMIKGVRRRTK